MTKDVDASWLVLAGGAGSRLGQDKASVDLGGSALVERAVRTLADIDPHANVSIVGPDRAGGPAAAVTSMLPDCRTSLLGVYAVDMPFAASAIARVITSAAEDPEADAWVPVDDGGRRQWLCALYRTEALRSAASGREWIDRAFHSLVASLTVVEVAVMESTSLLDVDTPADLERAREMIREDSEAHDG